MKISRICRVGPYLQNQFLCWRQNRARRAVLRQAGPDMDEIKPSDWPGSLTNPDAFYLRCFRHFHQRLPEDLQRHRRYFSTGRRGFGEEAFHVMWFLLFREFRPSNFLEIGVYRGQTLSLAALLQRRNGLADNVTGISPFEPVGDSVTRYREELDYLADTLKNFKFFSLSKPNLLKAYSTDKTALKFISSHSWDCIYIDGNHDYEVARADWRVCASKVKPGGLIVLDDSGLNTNYHPPVFATGGHPGPSQVAREISRPDFREILQVGHNRVFQKIG
jgi:SAM-dependent methyltransferase